MSGPTSCSQKEPDCDSVELLKAVLRNLAQQQSKFEEQARILNDMAEGQALLKNVLDHQHEVLRADIRAAHALPDEGTCTPSKGPCTPPTTMEKSVPVDSLRTSSKTCSPQEPSAGPEAEDLQEHSFAHESHAQPSRPKKQKFGVLATRHPVGQGLARMPTDSWTHGTSAGRLNRFVLSGKLDLCMGLVIWTNMITLSLQLQIRGVSRNFELGLPSGSTSIDYLGPVLERVDLGFIIIYWIEFLLRFWVQRCAFFWSFANGFDLTLVFVCTLDMLAAFDLGISDAPALSRLARLVRLLRVTRLLKVIRVLSICRELYLLVKTITTSVLGLCWGIMLIFQIIFACSLLMCATVGTYIEDTSMSLETRLWIHENFGTLTSALWTMFECTFSPRWQSFARPFVEQLHFAYLFFWLFYIVIVNFAIIRIVSAMFIKQTMAVAAAEEEKIFSMKGKEMERFAVILSEIFRHVDEDGDHDITTEQFEAVMARDDVHEYFEQLELEMEEVKMLFRVLSEPDGCADYEEFLSGAIRMKSCARTVDTIQILHEQLVMRRCLQSVESGLHDLRRRMSSRSAMPPASGPSAQALPVLGERSTTGYETNEEETREAKAGIRPTEHSEVEKANVPTLAPAPSTPEVWCEDSQATPKMQVSPEHEHGLGHASL